jgi:ABC-type transport system substrate-binding protein
MRGTFVLRIAFSNPIRQLEPAMHQSKFRKASAFGLLRLVVLLLSSVVIAFACSTQTQETQRSEPLTLIIGLPVQTGTDPLYGANQAARLASFEGLTTQSLDGRAIPRLAESWAESADGLAWTIRLRRSAVFHDGSPVDGPAVKRSLDAFLNSDASRFSPGLQDITAIEPSEHDLTIRLKQRSSLLLDDLDTPITKLDSTGSVIGTGPYIVSSTSPTEVQMSAFPRYYRGQPEIDRLVWRVYPTVRTAWAAAMRGDVDFLYEVGPDSREFLESEGSVELYAFLRNYVYALVFNNRRPIFEGSDVRRALNYAVDRTAIVERAFRGHAVVANGPAWPLHWAFDATAPAYVYDPVRAAAAVQKAAPRNRRFTFTCLIPENFQLWERLALMVQRNLTQIGVDMAVESVPFNVFNKRVGSGEFDAVLTEMVSGFSVSRPFFFWHSMGLSNFSGYRNSSTDRALEGVRAASSEPAYRDMFRQFQVATYEDPPAIFLAWGQTARAVNRRFQVIRAPGGDIRMTISDWRLATQSDQVAN